MASATKRNKEPLRIEIISPSRQSYSSGSPSPKLISPRDKKFRASFPLSPAIGTELERLKQTYSPSEKVAVPPPEQRPLVRSISTISQRGSNKNNKFRSLGGKVTNLLRVRKAFQTSKRDEDDIITSNKHLPIEPRFSSSLSPAAQFAMLKGYEDTVYANLCKHYPASKLFLKRSKTPPRGYIDIGDTERLKPITIPEDNQTDGNKPNKESANDTEIKTDRNKTDTEFSKGNKSESRVTIAVGVLNRRSTESDSKLKIHASGYNHKVTLTRAKSMPSVVKTAVPREKRLILSHRLQSAMDILDTVRGNFGENSISPRIPKYPRQIQPVSDFNQWSSIWSNEFKISRTKAYKT